jgi:hypothetical protein
MTELAGGPRLKSIAARISLGHHDRMGTVALRLSVLLAVLTSSLALGTSLSYADRGGDDSRREFRTRVTCTLGATMSVRLRAEGGEITIDLELEHLGRPGPWRLVILHERRIVRRVVLASRNSGMLQFRLRVSDWFGSDSVVGRASGPGGEACRATAIV